MNKYMYRLALMLFFLIISIGVYASGATDDSVQEEPVMESPVVQETSEPQKQIDSLFLSLGFDLPAQELPVPEFELIGMDGKSNKISDLRGQVVFLNFWATWCPPCRAEMPSMQKVYSQLQDKGFTIVGVNLREDKPTVSAFLNQNGFTFPVWLDTQGQIGGMFGVSGIPTTFIIDKMGNLRGRLVGTREWDVPEFIELINLLLEE